ncbi:MAG: insulinase family protein [Verrucomicrobia bacterium]|nr:insulinase family protein [Verrucomicrobiota bacterium]
MRISRLVLFTLALLADGHAFGASAPAAPVGARSGKWAHETPKSVAPDPHVTWGRLDNGLRYALLPHAGVPGRVTLQLIVLAGSLDERPDELGIAHYIEHLCFAGSRNFKAEDMVSLFQRLGVEYGSDINASTTFDATTFRLDFRENDAALLREGLRLFRDFGDGVNFAPAAIEQERRVVLAELRNRRTIADQQQRAAMPIAFAGLRFPERQPGGSEAQIAQFTREKFLQFYRRNYRPDLMVLVGAGDFDAAAIAAQVREIFGDLAKPAEPVPARDEGRLETRGLRAGVFLINGTGAASAEVSAVAPLAARPDSREVRVERQQRKFVMEAFAERLKADAKGGGAESAYDELLGHGFSVASLTVPAQAWKDGLISIDQLVRLTIERGLDREDVETLRRRQLKMAGHMLEQLPTVDPAMLCEALVESVTEHTVFEGYAQRFAWMREWLEHFTAADAQKVFRGLWATDAMAYHLAGGVDMNLTPEQVLKEVQKSRKSGINRVMARQHRDVPFTLPKFGAAGAVAERRELPAFGAKLLRFGNNVRLNFVSSRQEPGLVRAVVRVGTGLLTMPGQKPALKEFGLNTLLASGAVHFPAEDLQALIAERFMEFGCDVADRDAFTFRGMMAAEQLEPFLAVVADFLHAPQFNQFTMQEQRAQAIFERAGASLGLGEGMRALTNYLFKGDARFTWGNPLDYVALSVVDVRRWMEPSFASGYVEVTIVGDLPEDTVVQTATRTIGALRPRAAQKTTGTPPKPVKVTANFGVERIEFIGEQNMGLVVGTWPVTETIHVQDQCALEVLAKILEIKVRTEVREKLGLAYSPSAEFRAYDGFADFGLVQTTIDCAPRDTAKVAPLVSAIGARLATDGVGEGEFIGARGILKSQLRAAFRDNSFLVNVLMRAQERPEEADEIIALHAGLIDKLTREEVNAWAEKILQPRNCRAAAVVPKAFVGVLDGGR